MSKMTKMIGAFAVSLAAGFSLPAWAGGEVNQADASQLTSYVQSNGLACMSCHGVTEKKVGPAWIDVAQKYQHDAKAVSMVADRIQNGGVGSWGQTPMPPGMATHEQAEELAKMIMGLVKK
ncbi:MAG: c-type cytochrome [Gammaproteobacteria bacterium]